LPLPHEVCAAPLGQVTSQAFGPTPLQVTWHGPLQTTEQVETLLHSTVLPAPTSTAQVLLFEQV
jgi:hypothetical protein